MSLCRGIQPVLFCFLFLCSGCQYDPFAHTFTTTSVSTNDAVGKYRVVRQTVIPGNLEAFKGRPSEIDVRADGTFVATNIPPAGFDVGADVFSRLSSGEGEWEIGSNGSVDSGGKLATVIGLRLKAGTNDFSSPSFVGSPPPHGLIFTIGDGDSGHAIMYGKVVLTNGVETVVYPEIPHPIGFAPFSGPLAVLLVGFIAIILLVTALAIMLPLLAIAAIAGILSSSALVALYQRQAKAGFKAFVLQSSVAVSIPALWIILFVSFKVAGIGGSLLWVTLLSVIGGIPVGLLFGAAILSLTRLLVKKRPLALDSKSGAE